MTGSVGTVGAMTLVVARITDVRTGRVSLMADTKITDYSGDETANRDVFSRPGQKVVIVNNDLVVGYAGDNPDSAIEHTVSLRNSGFSRPQVLESLERFSGASSSLIRSFVVVERFPEPRIWQIRHGQCRERTEVRQCYVGDEDAYNRFRDRTMELGSDNTDEFRLVGPMISVITMDDLPTVGGYVVRVTGDRQMPFRFIGDPALIGPWFTHAAIRRDADGMQMKFSTPPGGDPTQHARIDIAGRGDTFSALVHAIPESGVAWLHTHEHPWGDAIRLDATSPQTVVDGAASHGQQLEMDGTVAERILNGDRLM